MKTIIASLFTYLRNLVLKRSRAFTCCAGCEDLPTPIGNRLCVSMKPRWKVDAVLLGDWSAAALRTTVVALCVAMPWLRRIHVSADDSEAFDKRVLALPKDVEEAELHRVKALVEHFIVFRSVAPLICLPATPLLREDFFTPNGLSLFFVAPGGTADAPNFLPGPAGRTKNLSALFAGACADDPILAAQCAKTGYTLAFARWAYAQQHGILAPSPFAA